MSHASDPSPTAGSDTELRLAVTGSTGVVGGLVAGLLAERGVPMRLLVRDAARAPELPDTAISVIGGYDDDAGVRAALAGIETLFLVSAFESTERIAHHRIMIDAAVDAGVHRIVYLSFFGAAPDAMFSFARDHFATEQDIRASGCAFTILQDNIYADYIGGMGAATGIILGPAGTGAFAPIARRDIAECAAAVLAAAAVSGREPSPNDGRAYRLTGPEELTMTQVAELISSTTGRQVRFQDQTLEDAYASRAGSGASEWEVEAGVTYFGAIGAGELGPATGDVAELIGRPATPLAEVLRG